MDLPARPAEAIATPPALRDALGVIPVEVLVNEFNYMAVLDDADAVRALAPDMPALAGIDRSGVIVTAAGNERYDVVSRYFAPAKGVPEDPVTGTAHCMLTPYWVARLNKPQLRAF